MIFKKKLALFLGIFIALPSNCPASYTDWLFQRSYNYALGLAGLVTVGLFCKWYWAPIKHSTMPTTVQPAKPQPVQTNQKEYRLNDAVSLIIKQGDITKEQNIDAIVNAANKELHGGSGVCGAIFSAAGRNQLQQACDKYPDLGDGVRCPTGQVRITASFNLQSRGIKHIIHAVGPDCRIVHDEKEQDRLLQEVYLHSLKLASEYKLTSISFPFISSAIYAFPKDRAARIALKTIRHFMQDTCFNFTSLKTIIFVLFSPEDEQLFAKTAQEVF